MKTRKWINSLPQKFQQPRDSWFVGYTTELAFSTPSLLPSGCETRVYSEDGEVGTVRVGGRKLLGRGHGLMGSQPSYFLNQLHHTYLFGHIFREKGIQVKLIPLTPGSYLLPCQHSYSPPRIMSFHAGLRPR